MFGFTPTPGFDRGSWEYICVDPQGVRIRATCFYEQKAKTGSALELGEVVRISERGAEGSITWLRLADGRGWTFERTNRRRMSQVRYEELHDAPGAAKKPTLMVYPPLGGSLRLTPTPYTAAGKSKDIRETLILPGSLVRPCRRALVAVQAKAKGQDLLRSFLQVSIDAGVAGWLPELIVDGGGKALWEFKIEPIETPRAHLGSLASEPGKPNWLSVLPGRRAPVYPCPGRSAETRRRLEPGDFERVAARCETGALAFLRLAEGGWVCEREGGRNTKPHVGLVELSEHRGHVYTCVASRGADVRTTPTRAGLKNSGKRISPGQQVEVSELARFPDGDTFLRIVRVLHSRYPVELDGWVPLLTRGGEPKMRLER